MNPFFLSKVSIFHERTLPEAGFPIGYALLLDAVEGQSGTKVPLPDILAICTEKHQKYDTDQWKVFTIRHRPKDDLASHLIFALKYEALDLYILKVFFGLLGKDVVLKMLKDEPTGQYARRAWFLYEWLMGEKLDVPDLGKGSYVDVVDTSIQYAVPPINSPRHRVRNNLPGTPEYCPLIRRTERLENYIQENLSQPIEIGLKNRDKDLIRRMAAFLLLKDSKASFAIEGEHPPYVRARNWGKAIGQAGRIQLTLKELERLQDIVMGNKKLKQMGLRSGEGFIGVHDRESFVPIPDHISAKSNDLVSLMRGLLETNSILQEARYDSVLIATTIAFGFVFIHPFYDGNGRIHRYIIHHILARTGYGKRGMIFPVSSAILNRIDEYQEVLEHFSSPRVELIQWRESDDHNVEIINATDMLYRYFDLTKQAEFLFECVAETIERTIPAELDYLEKYDRMFQFINNSFALTDTRVDLLIKFLHQNEGKLSNKKRTKNFDELTDEEISRVEHTFQDIFIDE